MAAELSIVDLNDRVRFKRTYVIVLALRRSRGVRVIYDSCRKIFDHIDLVVGKQQNRKSPVIQPFQCGSSDGAVIEGDLRISQDTFALGGMFFLA